MALHVEKSTSLIYEAKYFQEWVMVRPATPGFQKAIRRLSYVDFEKEFTDFCGNHEQIYRALGRYEGMEKPDDDDTINVTLQ